jgi:CRP/FNR family transcriptional regulator, cyclic AMP receptor protein
VGAADMIPVTVRGQDPAHVLERQAEGLEGWLDSGLRRGGYPCFDQRRLGSVDVVNVDDPARLPERAWDGHDARLRRHGQYVNVPAMASTASRVCTWYIRHVDMFQGLTPHDIDDMASAMTRRHFAAGQLIVGPETLPELVYLTRAGTVRLFHREADGSEITIERLYAGHLFGVTRFLGTDRGGLLARAETAVDLSVVEGARFLEVVSMWPQAILELALRLGVRVREGEEVLRRMSATGSRARLAGVLHRLARDASETQPGGGIRLRAVPRHSDLAAEIGATRETVTRMLARLEQDGYIRRFGRQIVVPDLNRLADDFDLEP